MFWIKRWAQPDFRAFSFFRQRFCEQWRTKGLFEPATHGLKVRCAARLRYRPMLPDCERPGRDNLTVVRSPSQCVKRPGRDFQNHLVNLNPGRSRDRAVF